MKLLLIIMIKGPDRGKARWDPSPEYQSSSFWNTNLHECTEVGSTGTLPVLLVTGYHALSIRSKLLAYVPEDCLGALKANFLRKFARYNT